MTQRTWGMIQWALCIGWCMIRHGLVYYLYYLVYDTLCMIQSCRVWWLHGTPLLQPCWCRIRRCLVYDTAVFGVQRCLVYDSAMFGQWTSGVWYSRVWCMIHLGWPVFGVWYSNVWCMIDYCAVYDTAMSVWYQTLLCHTQGLSISCTRLYCMIHTILLYHTPDILYHTPLWCIGSGGLRLHKPRKRLSNHFRVSGRQIAVCCDATVVSGVWYHGVWCMIQWHI